MLNGLVERLQWILRGRSSSAAIAFSLLSRVSVLAINVATGVIMARTLGPAGRGAVSAVTLWPLVICGVLTFGLPVAIRYNIRKNPDQASALLSTGLTLSLTLGVIAFTFGTAFIPRWLHNYSPDTIHFAQLMMFFSPLMTINALLQGFLEARGDFVQSGGMLLFPPAGTLLALIILAVTHRISIVSVPLAYELPFSCITLLTLYRVRRHIQWPQQLVMNSGVLLNFGLRAYGLDILSVLSAQIGQVIVIGILSAASFGLYAVAINVSRTLFVLSQSLNVVLFPKASELQENEAIELVRRSARVIFAANILAGGALIALMPLLIRAAYGAAYHDVVGVARILTCEVILAATIGTLSQAFMATNQPGIVTAFQVIGLATTFPLMLILVPRFGLVGAASSLLISTSLRFVLVLASYPVLLKHRLPRLILMKQDILDIRSRARNAMSRSARSSAR